MCSLQCQYKIKDDNDTSSILGEAVPGSGANTSPAVVCFMRAVCNGLPCPHYEANKLLTCTVCTQ